MLSYGSVCDGIGAVSCAWEPLGMRCSWRAEIAEFPSAVAAARWPGAPNLGDFTKIGLHEAVAAVDVVVGGTPCQSFSVAGGRAGMDDPRGHLAVEFLRLARRLRARWLVWENVPGVLSVDGGDAFRTFLGLAGECGYCVAWRVLDAQFFGVPQRRRRVFVVGYLGDWRPPAAVLLERPSLSRDPRARGAAGSSVAVAPRDGAPGSGGGSPTITAHHGRSNGHEDAFALEPVSRCITARRGRDGASSDQTFALVAFDTKQGGEGAGSVSVEVTPTITAARGRVGVFAFDQAQVTHPENRATVGPGRPVPSIARNSRPTVAGGLHPRRLTPREHERCFGFPDDYTLIQGAKDSPRYHALGNSMAVPVMAWIGRRMLVVERLLAGPGAA